MRTLCLRFAVALAVLTTGVVGASSGVSPADELSSTEPATVVTPAVSFAAPGVAAPVESLLVGGFPVAVGTTCAFAAAGAVDHQQAAITIAGGPLVAGSPGATVWMECSMHIGSENSAHNGTDIVTALSPDRTLQVTAAAAVPVPPELFYGPSDRPVYACTQIYVNGVVYYWDAIATEWSQSSSVPCAPGHNVGASL